MRAKTKGEWLEDLTKLPVADLLRSLPKMSEAGVFDLWKVLSDEEEAFLERLRDERFLDPFTVTEAVKRYAEGETRHDARLVGAMQDAFYDSFYSINPANKNTMVCVDVGPDMQQVPDGTNLMCCEIAGLVSMYVTRMEPNYAILGFCDEMRNLDVTKASEFQEAMQYMVLKSHGPVDTTLPMQSAIEKEVNIIDTFVIITTKDEHEGYFDENLSKYRKFADRPSKLVLVELMNKLDGQAGDMVDAFDPGVLYISGYDPNLIGAINQFSEEETDAREDK